MSDSIWEDLLRLRIRGRGSKKCYPALGRVALGGVVYLWIEGNKWAEDGMPAVTEMHGYLADPTTGTPYGRCMRPDEEDVVKEALLRWHGLRELPFED